MLTSSSWHRTCDGIFCWHTSSGTSQGSLLPSETGDPSGYASVSPLPLGTPRLPPPHPRRCLRPGFGMWEVRWRGFFLSLLSVFSEVLNSKQAPAGCESLLSLNFPLFFFPSGLVLMSYRQTWVWVSGDPQSEFWQLAAGWPNAMSRSHGAQIWKFMNARP